ncbi:MAG: hypothetical protein TREMPRED_004072 [Tremellales sp. Tagirdzhanova-0007]|nr:MAG: hypothetical protein TREMPRED_004072 [Tremellales sp. Tagirdzhanova-0007]
MSTSILKTRHYAALSSRLRNLSQNLSDTEYQFGMLAEQLQAMSRLGVNCGAQFMAVSRLLDVELKRTEATTEVREDDGQRADP